MRICLAAFAVLLAACGESPERSGSDPDRSDPRPAAEEAHPPLRAGAWAAEVRVVSIDSPDMAPEDLDEVKAAVMAEYPGHDSCLQPNETERPPQQFFSGSNEGCSYERLRLADGKVSGAMLCEPLPSGDPEGREPANHRMEFDGTYGPDSYSIQGRSVAESADGGRRVEFNLATRARRVGSC